jgi:hypothetical protein
MSRPSYKPTEEERTLVKSLAATGLPHDQICRLVRLRSPKTLRKYFARELSQGLAEATAIVAGVAYEMAHSGRHLAMTLFWLKCQAPCDESLDQEEEKVIYRRSRIIFQKPQRKEEPVDAAA